MLAYRSAISRSLRIGAADDAFLPKEERQLTAHLDSAYESPYRWVMLALGWSVYFCFGLISFSLAPLVTPIMKDLNLTYTQLGIAAGAWPLIYIAAAYPEGLAIDRIGIKKSLLIGALCVSASGALRAMANDFAGLFFAVAVFGLGAPLISVGLPKLIATWFSGQERGTASGIYYTGATAGIAVSLSATNAILLPLVRHWRICFLIYGIATLIVAMMWVRLARSPSAGSARASGGDQKTWDAMRKLVKHGSIWLVIIIGSTTFIVSHSLNNWLPKILESQAFTAAMAGIIAAIFSLFRIIGGLSIPRISSSVISRKLMTSGLLLATTLSIVAIQSGLELPLVLGIITAGVCLGAVAPLLLTLLMDMPAVGSKNMGAGGGLYFSFGEIGGVLGPVTIGYMRDVTGSFYTGLTVLAAVIGCMVVLSIFVKET